VVTARLLTPLLLAAVLMAMIAPPADAQGPGCAAPTNEIVAENCRPGTPASVWDVSGSGDPEIQGFATDISVAQGQTVRFKIDSVTNQYRLDIYRLGWYGGAGARKIATVSPLNAAPQQPACLTDGATGLVDCGNWSQSAAWAVPAAAVSGIYFAHLVREDGGGGESHVMFVVRDDDGASELLFQTSDTTWQAYNRYGGNSLYTGSPAGRAYKVSYNRPFTTRGYAPEDWVFNAEYPMVRWLERNGYDVSYTTGVDSQRRGAELFEHETFLSVGHDEYWSGGQRANVEAARAAGVNLAFFSGNEVFWKTRWEPSIDGSATANRTLVSYKETHANAKIDPQPGVWTGTWRDPRFSPPADGGRPENSLTGTIFTVNCCAVDLQVPSAEGKLRLWRHTSVATLAAGATATLGNETVGYEWDEDLDNGARPPGVVRMSSTTASGVDRLQDYGSTYASGTATHRLTLYRQPNGEGPDSIVFGGGTVQWSWGLDSQHDRGSAPADARMQQATVNLLADMDARPGTLQSGLIRALRSADCIPPASVPNVTTRAVSAGVPVMVSGRASDAGGRVGGVEVSVGGGSWHPAAGRESWSYSWTPGASGTVTIRSRAVDDSGNLEGVAACRGEPGLGGAAAGSPPGAKPRKRDRTAPRVRVGPGRVRVSRRGWVRLRITCPRRERICRVYLRLRRRGVTVARGRFRVAGGKTRTVSLLLKASLRRRLAHSGAVRVVVIGAARDAAGNRATFSARLRLLPPRPRPA
jgi:hypothetical protein